MKAVCSALLSIALSAFLAGCGTDAPIQGHQLVSVTISPATASAQGAPVQFIAIGHYNSAPFTVTPLTATWGISTYPQQMAPSRRMAWRPARKTQQERRRWRHG